MEHHSIGPAHSIRALWGQFAKDVLDRLAPIADLVARWYIAKVFFMAGWSKVTDWESTLFLFREEYHVSLLPPEVAAVLGTAGELGLSVLLALGLFTRFAACGLFIVNIVAVMSYYDALKDTPAAIHDHLEWGIILALLLVTQVRQLTVDHLLLRRLFRAG